MHFIRNVVAHVPKAE
ncbi:hypothetical protein [Ornithinimicrobium murale]